LITIHPGSRRGIARVNAGACEYSFQLSRAGN
jgi:hypothetical protein